MRIKLELIKLLSKLEEFINCLLYFIYINFLKIRIIYVLII